MAFSWTVERVEALRHLWSEGLTATKIMKELGCPSKNSVIGKAHRLQLPKRKTGRGNDTERSPRPSRSKAALQAKPIRQHKPAENFGIPKVKLIKGPPRLKVIPLPELTDAPVYKATKVKDLKDRHCRWPVGDPRNSEFFFCGCEKYPGYVYCAYHCRMAYRPRTEKQRRAG